MLAIASGKGGCGKTTTAVGLARALAREGQTPLVVDADTGMPDLHLRVDVPRTPGLGALADGGTPARVAHRAGGGFAVLPVGTIAPDVVPSALDRLVAWDGPVLVDCPAGAARDAAMPLREADGTLLVTNPRAETLRDTAKTAAMARALDAPPLGVVSIDRSVAGPDDARLTDADARGLFGCPVCGRIPNADAPVLRAERVRTAYRAVARKLSKRNI